MSNQEIVKLQQEMNSEIQKIKDTYTDKINKVRFKQKTNKIETYHKQIQLMEKVATNLEFNTYWDMYLKVYDCIYKNKTTNK